ncbi:MAG TPA: lytic murein transglycosylase [Vicinamibacterales bacterium]|nr:lytic murein transglycosylase [Vicinamibacterales bacterium]
MRNALALVLFPFAFTLSFALCPLPFALLTESASAQDPPPSTQPSFEDWLAALRQEALTRGISQATIDLALSNIVPEPVVVSRDRAQPELTQSLDAYLSQRLTARTIARARDAAKTHHALLERVETKYGVPRPVMVAIWGLESNFGQFTGVRPTIAALATLAFDPRRATLFRNELFDALTILDRGLVAPDTLKGSWAGAMGQPQFMPSSFLRHAIDFDADGRIDIWTSEADVFGSMANYLSAAGWDKAGRWGREVRISRAVMGQIDRTVRMRTSGCRARREMTVARPLAEWKKLGVQLASGAPLPVAKVDASLVRGRRRHFLVYRNYDALLDYNCSNSYAVAVGVLSDRVQ